MALPVLTDAADGEEDLIHGSDGAGYSQIPADHLSDSSESSYGPSDDLTYDTPDVVSASEALVASAAHNSVANNGGSPFLQNGGSVAHGHGTGNGALIQNSNGRGIDGMDNRAAPHNSGSHINVREEMQNSGLLHSNAGHDLHINHMQNHATYSRDAPHGHVVHIDGMEIHVYGQLAGLQLSAPPHHTNTIYEDADHVDDVDENEWQCEEDTAMLRVKEEEEARRSAPLPPERCQAIRNAMQSISLGGYQPEWAHKIPEEQWLNRLRRK